MEFASYWLGLDLGQVQDFTALAVMERAELTGEWDPMVFAYRKEITLSLRHLERVPLRTEYPAIVERVRKVTQQRELKGRIQIVVDATGVGAPVVDLLRKADLGCTIQAVTITGGNHEGGDRHSHLVPKRDLILGLQVMLQQRTLLMASAMKGMGELVKEMNEMRVKVSLGGKEQYGAWREGEHDDLVLAVALACWGVRKAYPNLPSGENAYWRRDGGRDWDILGATRWTG